MDGEKKKKLVAHGTKTIFQIDFMIRSILVYHMLHTHTHSYEFLRQNLSEANPPKIE